MVPPKEERRKEPRLQRKEKLFAKILSSPTHPSLKSNVQACFTDDVSRGGLKIQLDQAVPIGCLLDLWVSMSSRPGTFLLTGEVKWLKQEGDEGAFCAGIAIQERPGDDFSAWAATLSEECSQPDH